jgi:hypothetical protein
MGTYNYEIGILILCLEGTFATTCSSSDHLRLYFNPMSRGLLLERHNMALARTELGPVMENSIFYPSVS